jgi:hypothetical protein
MKRFLVGRALLPGLMIAAAVEVQADFEEIRNRSADLLPQTPAAVSQSAATAADAANAQRQELAATGGAVSLGDAAGAAQLGTTVIRRPVIEIVDEAILPGATVFRYPYPATPPPGMTDREAFAGRSSMQLVLTPKSWSGMSVCWGGGRDLSKIRSKGAIEFWVKGGQEGWGPYEVGLSDDGKHSNGRQQGAYVSAMTYGNVTKDGWTHIVIPLKDLGFEGSYWDDGLNAKVQNLFNWSAVTCFNINNSDNSIPNFNLYFDKVRIIADTASAR